MRRKKRMAWKKDKPRIIFDAEALKRKKVTKRVSKASFNGTKQ